MFLKFLILLLLNISLFANSNSSILFSSITKKPKSLIVKKYTWDENTKITSLKESIHTNVSNFNSEYFENDVLNFLSSNQNNQKIEYEYEFENFLESSFNYKNQKELTNNTGLNKYKNTIVSSSIKDKNRNNQVDSLRKTVSKAIILTSVSNYGQKGQTLVVRSFLNEDNQKLIVSAEKVNYLEVYKNDIVDRCKNNLPIPKMMYSLMATINLTSPDPASGFDNVPGIIDLEKNGSLCKKSNNEIIDILLSTNLFYPSGDLKLFFKDQNWNKLVASAFTADIVYFNEGTEASIVFDKPSNSDVKMTTVIAKNIGRIVTYSFSTSIDWYKLVSLSMIHTTPEYGSYSILDYDKNGTKVSGVWAQRPNIYNGDVTPDGHSINFLLLPNKGSLNEAFLKEENFLNTTTAPKVTWDSFLANICSMSVLESYMGSDWIKRNNVGPEFLFWSSITETVSVGKISQSNMINKESSLSRVTYNKYLKDYVEKKPLDISETNKQGFWLGQYTKNVSNSMDKNLGYSETGTQVYALLGTIPLFTPSQRNSITRKAAIGSTIYSDNYMRMQSNFRNRVRLISPIINNLFDFQISNVNNFKLNDNKDIKEDVNSQSNEKLEIDGVKNIEKSEIIY